MADINIGSTSYMIQDEWFKVALKYFNLDPENEVAINMLKAGLFGYNNEIQSNEIKNNVYHRNVLYDEHFLNTASFPESIANFAKLTNVDMELATPAKMRATLAISRDDIINSPLKKQIKSIDTTLEGFSRKVYTLTISRDFVFSIKQIPFRLPYDLQFIIKENEITGKYSISVKYDTSNSEFPFLKVTSNPYLKTWNETTSEGDYIFIGIDLYQLHKASTTFAITGNNYMDNLFLTTHFNNQIAYIEVNYIYNGNKIKVNPYQNNQYASLSDKAFCYYMIKGSTLELSFGADSNSFRPRKNSEIEVIMYTTYGSRGNFSYTGNIDVNFSTADGFSNISVNVTPITNSSGGKNKFTTTELKNKITESMLTRKNIITDTDLNYYFANFNTNTTVNGSNIEFFKKRNDILKRVFTGYITMRERSGKIIPTNTAPHLLINKNYIDNPFMDNDKEIIEKSKGLIRDNTLVTYDRMNDKFVLSSIKKKDDEYDRNVFMSVDKDGEFIIDKTDENLNFVYNILNQTYSYYYKDKENDNILYEDLYMAVGTNIRQSTIEHNTLSATKEKLSEITLFDKADIKCKNNNFIIFLKDNRLNLSLECDNYENENNMIIYKADTHGFTINSDEYLSNDRFIYYTIPYTLKIIDEPVLKCNYYITSLYEIYPLKLNNINNFIDRNFTFNNIQIEKNPNVDMLDSNSFSNYIFTLDLNTNLSIDELDEKCKIRMIIYNDKKEVKGYIEMEHYEDSFKYYANMSSYRDIINKNEEIMIRGSLKDLNNGNNIDTTFLSNKIYIDVAVLYKDQEDVTKYGNFDYMHDVGQYATACVYSNDEPISIFRNLENYMYSDIEPIKIHDTNGDVISEYYDLKQVPLVEYSFFQKKYDEILDILDVYDDVSYDLINTLENNNSLDLKFTNTYGTSNYWVTDTNGLEFKEENFDYVDVTSIPLNFTIYTNSTVDAAGDARIKEFISEFVESSNLSGLFAISNLLRELENSFSEIQYVEFGKVAGEETQKIFNTFKGFNNMTSQEINDYVPEFLNIKKILREDDSMTNDGINIPLKYDYDINVTYK